MKHPAKYSDALIPIFAEILSNSEVILDPMAGTGKLAKIRDYGWEGIIYCNDILDWGDAKIKNGVDNWTFRDASFMNFEHEFFDAICTSPTYGNRMADHFDATDTSRRITYRHYYGKPLFNDNTGRMQWGHLYRFKHKHVYQQCHKLLKPSGLFILNISNHIRNGKVIDVAGWHKKILREVGFKYSRTIKVATPRMRFGRNYLLRPNVEYIFVFSKGENHD